MSELPDGMMHIVRHNQLHQVPMLLTIEALCGAVLTHTEPVIMFHDDPLTCQACLQKKAELRQVAAPVRDMRHMTTSEAYRAARARFR